ncbi:MAG: hypothetical protein AABY51_00920 [Deltaproteobacteria bacterium]
MIDETEALAKGIMTALPEEIRAHLRHRLRNGLQAIISTIEVGTIDASMDSVIDMGEDLRRLGL